MSILSPPDHAAAIVAHYLKVLTEQSGLRWTAANDRDMQTLADLLGASEEPQLDEMPPYEPPIVSDRQTVVLERDPLQIAADEARTRRWQYDEADDVPVRRMLRREGGAR